LQGAYCSRRFSRLVAGAAAAAGADGGDAGAVDEDADDPSSF